MRTPPDEFNGSSSLVLYEVCRGLLRMQQRKQRKYDTTSSINISNSSNISNILPFKEDTGSVRSSESEHHITTNTAF
jgi:hypothetical protein